MNKKEYELLLKEWKKFLLNEDSNLDIKNQIIKAEKLVEEMRIKNSKFPNVQLKIEINALSNNEYELISNIAEEDVVTNMIAKIYFSKLPNNSVFDNSGKERKCFIIDHTEYVRYDLGPLMYDLIIEFVSKKEAVLCSDRYEVSVEAKSLWSNYFSNRSDVFAAQLDIDNDMLDPETYPNLTPDYWKDDLRQDVAIKDKNKNWHESAFSKGYYKENYFVTESLESNKLFILNI